MFAVLGHEDIPMWPRLLLAVRIGKAQPTDKIKIFKDRIESESGEVYQPGVFEMNFGNGEKCDTIRMDHWPAEKFEPAPVWCVKSGGMEWCEAMPTVCNNVSMVFKDKSRQRESEVYENERHRVPAPESIYLTLGAIGAALYFSRRKKNGRWKIGRKTPRIR